MIHARNDWNEPNVLDNLIPKDEPVFLLRAQDPQAPGLLRQWAGGHLMRGGDPAMARLALDQADKMERWPVKKSPSDLPKTT